MGLRFRKSINVGPFRVNISRSGVGYSVGTRGFRVGQSARKKRYVTASLPGTGLSYRKPLKSGCAVLLASCISLVMLVFFITAGMR